MPKKNIFEMHSHPKVCYNQNFVNTRIEEVGQIFVLAATVAW